HRPLGETFALVPLPGVGEGGREGVARADAELLPDLEGRMHGVAVVNEVLAEDRSWPVEILQECRVKVPERYGSSHGLGDELHEADLGHGVFAHDILGLAVALWIAEHGGHGDGQVFHMTELAQPASVAGDEHGPATRDP